MEEQTGKTAAETPSLDPGAPYCPFMPPPQGYDLASCVGAACGIWIDYPGGCALKLMGETAHETGTWMAANSWRLNELIRKLMGS